jgi:cobalt-zinc-cadmium efflux system membrane fusion protein
MANIGSTRRAIPTVLSVIVAATLLCQACGKDTETQALSTREPTDAKSGHVRINPKALQELTVRTVQSQPLGEELIVQGRIQYSLDGFVKISSPLRGLVRAVRVKLGDNVAAGEPILAVESPDIGTAYADFAAAESELHLARRNFELALDLYRVKALPKKDFDLAQTDLRKNKAEYDRARERLLTLKISEKELDKPRDQRRITAQFDVKSPLNGVIVEKLVTVGQLIDTADILYTVADMDVLQAVGEVYERDIRLLSPGITASVKVESFPQDLFPAVITYVGDVVDPTTRTIKIRCDVTNLDRKLKADMFARIHLQVGAQNMGVALPREAVIRMDGDAFVFVQSNQEEYERRQVVTGSLMGDLLEIRDGVKTGEAVVVKGGLLLQSALEKQATQ